MHHLLAFSTAYRTQLPSKFSHTHPVTHRARSVSIVICLIAATSSTPLHRWHSVDEAPLQRHFFTAAAVFSPPPPLHTAVSPPPRSVHRVHSIRLRSPRAGSTPPLHRLHVTAAVSSPPQPPRFRHHCLALVPSILPISSHYQFFTAAVLASPPKSLHRRSLFTVVISLHCHHIPSTHDYHFLQPSLLLCCCLFTTVTASHCYHRNTTAPLAAFTPHHRQALSQPPPLFTAAISSLPPQHHRPIASKAAPTSQPPSLPQPQQTPPSSPSPPQSPPASPPWVLPPLRPLPNCRHIFTAAVSSSPHTTLSSSLPTNSSVHRRTLSSLPSPLHYLSPLTLSPLVRILAARLCAVTSMLPSPPAIPGCRPVTLTVDASVVATKVARSRVCHS